MLHQYYKFCLLLLLYCSIFACNYMWVRFWWILVNCWWCLLLCRYIVIWLTNSPILYQLVFSATQVYTWLISLCWCIKLIWRVSKWVYMKQCQLLGHVRRNIAVSGNIIVIDIHVILMTTATYNSKLSQVVYYTHHAVIRNLKWTALHNANIFTCYDKRSGIRWLSVWDRQSVYDQKTLSCHSKICHRWH